MRTYNKHKALELYKEFKQLTKVDVFKKTRQTKPMSLRALFYKVLRDNNFMNDREIAEFFAEMGNKINRSSIYHSLQKIDGYYFNFDFFKDYYDLYFDDLSNNQKGGVIGGAIGGAIDATEALTKRQKRINTLINDKDALDKLIDTLEGSRRQEIYELVKLRIKSWSWKVEDRCEIIEGLGTVEGVF
jgi:hypothetical protein